MFIEISSIFLPCWQAIRHQALQQETLDIIAAWESRNTTLDSNSLGAATLRKKARHESSFFEKATKWSASTSSTTWSDNSSLLNMSALERTLDSNPGPLRDFSALNDFSGENIAFLEAVAEWKSTFSTENVRNQFIRALGIYHEFISPHYAEFPINISFQEMAQLEATFEKAARVIYGDTQVNSPATSFTPGSDWPMETIVAKRSYGSEVVDSPDNSTRELRSSLKHVSYWGEIPVGFSAQIFDQAERSIKYLVLTNTWPKFLSWKSSEMSRADFHLTNYDSSIIGRISRLLSCDV